MATIEVFHKAAGVRSSSKVTDSFVTSFPGLLHVIAFNSVYIHGTFETNSASLGHLSKSGKVFLEFIDSQLQIAVRLAHEVLIVHSKSARKKHFSFPV